MRFACYSGQKPRMGLRGPHSMASIRRTQPVAKAHVTYRLTCWHCRAAFIARRLDAEYCSGRCRSAPNASAKPSKPDEAHVKGHKKHEKMCTVRCTIADRV